MNKQFTNGLQVRVFIGLGIMLLGSAAVVAYLNLLSQENNANQDLLSYVRQLDVQGQAIKRRGTTYANHAPRDYAPYERDITIFYPDFMKDLDAFDKQISHIVKVEKNLPRGLLHSDDNTLSTSILNLQSNWRNFRRGFQEKLGDNPQEPRLEWGADYVLENQELINSITGKLISTIENVIQQQLNANKQFSNIATMGAGALLILGVIWFYLRIVRRITLTVQGCQRVAQGDFGYQLPIESNDELGALANAFNTLSARTRFVLTMLSKMHRHGSAESKIDSLWKEAGGYLPIQWIGLWQVNHTENNLLFMSMRSERKMSNSVQQSLISVSLKDEHLLKLSKEHTTIKYDNLPDVATSIPTAKVMREILKLGLLKSVLIVPLTADDGWEGLLVFVATDSSAYSEEQIELMGNLAPFMANGFAQAEK